MWYYGLFLIAFILIHAFWKSKNTTPVLPPIFIVTNERDCKLACKVLKEHCQYLSALGFDCEWVNIGGPVSLLQLATVKNFCCLFRLNILKKIPTELREILSDPQILKLGVDPLNDGTLLERDYYIEMWSTLDLNWLFSNTKRSLAKLALDVTGLKLNKSLWLQCSNWEKPELSSAQIQYAADDALVAIKIFKSWLLRKSKGKYSSVDSEENVSKKTFQELQSKIYKCVDRNFIPNSLEVIEGPFYENARQRNNDYTTRRTPLYDNCFMHAPDGDLLNSCNRRKAEWYVEKGLAEVFQIEPYSIRLLFEPAGRGVEKNQKKYYQQLKQNCCVVCGETESYKKHNVVPKEYRKHFPNKMKDHQSHDILLLCYKCHNLANIHNQLLRKRLSIKCNAPLGSEENTKRMELVNIKICARALLNSAHVIPTGRKIKMENKLKSFFKISAITKEILKEIANMDTKCTAVNKESHGFKVVNYYKSNSEGLKALEVLWRKYFLHTMEPQFMPAFWSINHNHSCLTDACDNKEQ